MEAWQFAARCRWHLWMLAVSLVLAQGVALLHGIAHAPQLVEVAGPGFVDGLADRLFGDHHDQDHSGDGDENTTCRLFDQTSQPDSLLGIYAATPRAGAARSYPAAFSGLHAVRRQAAFEARGPPAFC